jgi:nitrile hydratase subunit beta
MIAVDGVHDLGGLLGFGPVDRAPEEEAFHRSWEGRVFGMAIGSMMAGLFGTPAFRHAIERMDAVHYLTSSYFEHWLTGLGTLLVETGTVSADELAAGTGSFPLSRPVHPDPVLFAGPADARFAAGDDVRVLDRHPTGHTRCPDYVRGHVGVVIRVDGPTNVPELEAHQGVLVTEPTYGVRFTCCELWGPDAGRGESVTVDLYDRYLEPV